MIIVYHDNNKVINVESTFSKFSLEKKTASIIECLVHFAENRPNTILVWCHLTQKDNVDLQVIEQEFTLKNMMISYASGFYISESIGYVEDSSFIKVNKNVKYPTWLMSGQVGAIYAETLLLFKDVITINKDFNYTLNSIAKLGIPNGLICYSCPNLLREPSAAIQNSASTFKLFKFVKQHYKLQWVFLLLLNLFIYEKRLPIFSFFKSLFSNRINLNVSFITKRVNNKYTISQIPKTVDVIIPTMGRKPFLYNVLQDLSKQTLLPSQVIIIEQNPHQDSSSELDYLKHNSWPFNVVHEFTNQTGACKARNLALSKVKASYGFFADDDIRIGKNVLKEAIDRMVLYKWQVATLSCLQKDEEELSKQDKQWSSFGSGCSFFETKALQGVQFDLALEHGFGEDIDFGMQIRNKGIDVVYFPNINIIHLKAPIGGFRTKFEFPWDKETTPPKPSPTIMYNRKKNTTKQQVLGYKTVLFFKYYKVQKIKNPLRYLNHFKKQWDKSVYWANKL